MGEYEMKLIELCYYTLRQSLSDEGKYPPFYAASELIDAFGDKKETKQFEKDGLIKWKKI